MSASDFPQPFTTSGVATATGVAAHKPERDATAETRRVLLDVCCGAGTLGLVLARQCGCSQVLGVETCAPAVKDARLNARANGLDDISTYACGPAETKIDELLKFSKQQHELNGSEAEVIAIVDPARTGLKPSVCAAIRAQSSIRRVLFVSCNPHGHNMRYDYTVKVKSHAVSVR